MLDLSFLSRYFALGEKEAGTVFCFSPRSKWVAHLRYISSNSDPKGWDPRRMSPSLGLHTCHPSRAVGGGETRDDRFCCMGWLL